MILYCICRYKNKKMCNLQKNDNIGLITFGVVRILRNLLARVVLSTVKALKTSDAYTMLYAVFFIFCLPFFEMIKPVGPKIVSFSF